MGIVYYLAREDNRTLFEIGKWTAISDVFEDLGGHRAWAQFILPEEAVLRALLRTAIADERLSVDRDTYTTELARRIIVFGSGQLIRLANDCSSDEYLYDNFSDRNDGLNVIDALYTSTWGDWAVQHPAKEPDREVKEKGP